MTQESLWSSAARLAEETPKERNRYVDLLRALSISVVVLGHWIMAAPHVSETGPLLAHLLDSVPWSRWLTWIFQVMPVFFFVGGYSNGTSWDSARRRGQDYPFWLEARMRRLMGPVVPLLLVWIVLAVVAHGLGVPKPMIRVGSQVGLVPIWFLAIYLVIVMWVPVSRWAWHRFGMSSVWFPAGLAALNDLIFFNTSHQWLGWSNYLFVWSAVHQLGYAWQSGRLHSRTAMLALAAFGSALLWSLTQLGPYPTSLVGVPSEAISNTTPPKLPVLCLALTQIGLLLSLEGPLRRWLTRKSVWTATVLVNGMIMPLFLWHSTVMMLVIGVGLWFLPQLFEAHPGTALWWGLRPPWVILFGLLTLPLVLVFGRYERGISRLPQRSLQLWRLLLGAFALCAGLALLAAGGVSGEGLLGLAWPAVLLPLVGSAVAGFGPLVLLRHEPVEGGRRP